MSKNAEIPTRADFNFGMRLTGRNSSGEYDEYAKNFANIHKKTPFVKGQMHF